METGGWPTHSSITGDAQDPLGVDDRYGAPIRLFTDAPGRGGGQASSLYAGIRTGAVLMSDGYEVYNAIAAANGLTHLGCWAHARRYFVEAEAVIPKAVRGSGQLTTQFIAAIGELYALEAKAKDFTPEQRGQWRLAHSRPILLNIEALLLRHLHHVAPNCLLGKALHYLSAQWLKLIRFVENGTWPIDNNACENAIRPFVIAATGCLPIPSAGRRPAPSSIR